MDSAEYYLLILEFFLLVISSQVKDFRQKSGKIRTMFYKSSWQYEEKIG